MDSLTPTERSRVMGLVRSKDTRPEMLVRSLVHGLGYRFRLHVNHLPGRPDIVFPSKKKIILVHGCFWHRHSCKRGRSMPTSRRPFWLQKLRANRLRDRQNVFALRQLGWKVYVVWECQTRDLTRLTRQVLSFLGSSR